MTKEDMVPVKSRVVVPEIPWLKLAILTLQSPLRYGIISRGFSRPEKLWDLE